MSNFNPRNNIYRNWKKNMYIANKKEVQVDDYNNEIVVYNKPFYFGKVNYQPLTTKQLEAYIKTYGETENNVVSCLIDYKDKDKFNIFDVAYLYNASPINEVKNGANANYKVRAFKPQNTKIMVVLEEIIKED
ncbi:MAG: hypothetical protein IKU37_01260 [Candidatus Gastranaerophilales bacterium]|nr:hypothetical protein [Candidatus Gastranaerophilales bacterium]